MLFFLDDIMPKIISMLKIDDDLEITSISTYLSTYDRFLYINFKYKDEELEIHHSSKYNKWYNKFKVSYTIASKVMNGTEEIMLMVINNENEKNKSYSSNFHMYNVPKKEDDLKKYWSYLNHVTNWKIYNK